MSDISKKCSDWCKAHKKQIMGFNRGPDDFIPSHYPPKEEGMYLTIRCGLSGIYQDIDAWKDGKWQCMVIDGSRVIAYSRNRIEMPDFSKEDKI